MQFKHPEILYFLFLLIIPILVHLFQLRRFKKELFTNVRFLKELSIQTRKSSKIKKWLLLATRLLIFTCLVLAFAQPFFEAKDHKNKSNETFIVLDNSFSMQAKGKKGELLKRAVEDLLEHVPENQPFSLVTNTETFWNTDIKSIRKDLQNLSYSAAAFDPVSALAKIRSRKTVVGKDVIVISDAVGLQSRQLNGFDKELNTYFIVPNAEQQNNVSIDSVFINQTLDNFYEIGVKLSAYGSDFGSLPIALYNQGKLAAKTVVKPDTSEKTIGFTIPKEDFHGYVTIEDNSLAYDNSYYFSLSKPQKTNVMSIGEAAKSQFLSRIYTPDEFDYNNFALESLDYNRIEKQDAIVLNELVKIPQALQTTLKSFVSKGGNLIVIPATDSNVADLNALLSNFGGMQFKAGQSLEKRITKIAFNNPVFQSVFEKQVTNFQYPSVKSSFALAASTPAILSYEDQSPFLASVANGVSSVYVFSGAINKMNSNFQNSPLIVPVFYNMAQNTQKTGISALSIGANSPVFIDALLAKDEILNVRGNADGSTEKFIPTQQILNNKVKIVCNDYPSLAGNYGIYKQDERLKDISFNYPRTESNLRADHDSALSGQKVIESIEAVLDTLQTDRTDNEIWKWFVIFTLLFLATELLIQKFVK
ncbi:MAG TPA: BatA and WFA domain-containing protein [Flavobacterium sp.]|nr:BatA and WFA domain-containing protein [Flavobacterium sp.]